jgi:N-acetyltransferase
VGGWIFWNAAKKRTDLPFVAVHLEIGRVAGATRYLNIMPNDRGLEIGGTWYGTGFSAYGG